MNRFQGKIAIVTGASRGIGAAVARRLAAEGAAVAVVYGHSPDKAKGVVESIVAAGGKAEAFRADAANPEAMPQLVHEVVARFGRLDVVVNNAVCLKEPV